MSSCVSPWSENMSVQIAVVKANERDITAAKYRRSGLNLKQSFVLLLLVILLSVPVLAHHGSAISYETQLEKAVTMKGTVTEFVWRNPHCYIIYNVKDANGKVVEWTAETSSPSSMTGEHGWSRTTVKAGDELTFMVLPS